MQEEHRAGNPYGVWGLQMATLPCSVLQGALALLRQTTDLHLKKKNFLISLKTEKQNQQESFLFVQLAFLCRGCF